MRRTQLMETVAVLTNCPLGTVGTRFDDLLSDGLASKGTRGRNGGADMTPTDRINLLLAVAIDHPRGKPIGQAVSRIRSLEMHAVRLTHGLDISIEQGIRGGFDFVTGLNISADDRLGVVLDGIVQNMQTGAFARWAAGDEITLTLDFYAKGQAAMLVLDRPDGCGVYFAFGVDEEFRPSEIGVDRLTRMHRRVFERLAAEEEALNE